MAVYNGAFLVFREVCHAVVFPGEVHANAPFHILGGNDVAVKLHLQAGVAHVADIVVVAAIADAVGR